MKINELLKIKKPVIALEVFPPKPDVPIETIYDSLEKFAALMPDYISVTYGAGGSQRGRTVEIATKIKQGYGIESMSHFTCVGHSKEEIDEMLASMHECGIENILALRGDPPVNQPDYDYSKGAFKYANELVSHIRGKNGFCIAAAAYLEGHVDAKRLKDDLYNLKQKVDAGVNFLVTQLFFDNRLYFEFLDKAESIGIKCPIIPGIMPIFTSQIKTMTARSGCSLPATLVLMMDKYHDNPEDLRKAGIEYASKQIADLIENGAPGVHLYSMNRPKSTAEILKNAGLR